MAAASDTAEALPDDRTFANLHEFIGCLADERLDSRYRFGEVFIRQLASYALGRRLSLADEALVRDLVSAARREGWRLLALITALVTSTAFTPG